MDLNDDCILGILSMKCLSLVDLCSVATTCRRLSEIARQVYKREHKHKTFDVQLLSEGNLARAKQFLMLFGSEMLDLELQGEPNLSEWSSQLLEYVTEHCSTVQTLNLKCYNIPANLTAKLRPVFNKLEKLRMNGCKFEGSSKELFADCASLMELEIYDVDHNVAFIFGHTFPKLEHFECTHIEDSDWLAPFITRNLSLRSLRILFVVGPSLLSSIANCKRLETLILTRSIPENGMLDLSNLRHLRKLDIICFRKIVSENTLGLQNLHSLEELTLHAAEIDSELVGTLSQLRQLQVLKLLYCTELTELHNLNSMGELGQLTTLEITSRERFLFLELDLLVQRLSKLNCLKIRQRRFNIDLETYWRIVDVVRERPDGTKLTIRLGVSSTFNFNDLVTHFSSNTHLVEIIFDCSPH